MAHQQSILNLPDESMRLIYHRAPFDSILGPGASSVKSVLLRPPTLQRRSIAADSEENFARYMADIILLELVIDSTAGGTKW
jgi:hypothetical protein